MNLNFYIYANKKQLNENFYAKRSKNELLTKRNSSEAKQNKKFDAKQSKNKF